jgi:hypothetical protein
MQIGCRFLANAETIGAKGFDLSRPEPARLPGDRYWDSDSRKWTSQPLAGAAKRRGLWRYLLGLSQTPQV